MNWACMSVGKPGCGAVAMSTASIQSLRLFWLTKYSVTPSSPSDQPLWVASTPIFTGRLGALALSATVLGLLYGARSSFQLSFRWGDDTGDLYRNGVKIGSFDGNTVQVASRGECHIYQLYLNNGYSGPIYVNCPFAANVRP